MKSSGAVSFNNPYRSESSAAALVDSGVDVCVFEEAVFAVAVFEEAVFEEPVGGDGSSWAEGELDLVASLGWAGSR